MRVASLGMYDHVGQRAANDALWSAIGRHLRAHDVAAPDRLDRGRSVERIWRDPELLLAQSCGYPLMTDRELDLRVVAVPSYAVPDCDAGRHCSRIVVRAGNPARSLSDLRGSVAAINAPESNTGANLLRAAVAPLADGASFFGDVIVTGAHRASLAALAEGRADIAAIDAVTFAAIERFEPAAVAALRVLGNTPSSPALPFVTARTTSAATMTALREAIVAAIHDPGLADVRQCLFLTDITIGDENDYAEILALRRGAAALGYPALR